MGQPNQAVEAMSMQWEEPAAPVAAAPAPLPQPLTQAPTFPMAAVETAPVRRLPKIAASAPGAASGEEEHRPYLAAFSMREAPGWAISLGIHLVVLFMLAGIRQATKTEEDTVVTSSIEELQ